MIVYANLCCLDHQTSGLEKLMRQKMPGKAEYLYDLEGLKKRLRASVYDIEVMVIHISGASPIAELLEHQNDLKELKIILILNGTASNDQIEQLLKLYPRYMTFDTVDDTIISLLEQRVKDCVPDSKDMSKNSRRQSA